MKSITKFLSLLAIIIAFPSCSSDNSPKTFSDSFNPNAVMEKKVIQTDSGKIEIEMVQGSNEGKAILYSEQGKVLQKGMYVNNQPAGAWIKYDAAGNVISAEHFSKGKPLLQLDKNDFNFREWDNQKIGLKFKVPKDWKEIPSPNPALLVSFEKRNIDSTHVHVKPNFSIVRATLQRGEDLQSLAKMQMDLMHKNYDRVEPPIDENNIVVDSCLAFRRYGMYSSGNQQVGYLNVIIVQGINVWFFSCEAQNNEQAEFLKYQGVFEEILESIQRTK